MLTSYPFLECSDDFTFVLSNLKYSQHCVKSVRFRSYSGPHFAAFGLNTVRMQENADQNNFDYGHFLRSASVS